MLTSRKQGEHLDNKKTKSRIIESILEKKEKISEPDIRDRLKKDFNVIDQGTINKHLHNLLAKEFGCIEFIPPDKKGLKNHWNITDIKTLRSIRHGFPEIPLNKYEKAITIVSKELGYSIDSIKGLEFYIRLYRSASLFNICLETDIDTLRKRAWNVYLRDEGFETNLHIKKLLNELYNKYIEDNPNFGMSKEDFQEVTKKIDQMGSMNSEYTFFGITDLSSDFYKENVAGFEDIKSRFMFMEPESPYPIFGAPLYLASNFFMGKFKGLAKAMSRYIYMMFENESAYRTDNSLTRRCKFNEEFDEEDKKMQETIFVEMCNECYKNNDDWRGMSLETFQKTMVEDRNLYMKMDEILYLIKTQHIAFHEGGFGLQLPHFVNHDILIGAEPDEEFEKKIKEIESNLRSEQDKSVGFAYTGDCMHNLLVLRIAIEFILKYKQPKIFCVSDDKIVIFKYLLKFYAYPLNLSGLFIEEKGSLKSLLELYGLKEQES